MLRRRFLHAATLAAIPLAPRAAAGQFTGRIRKSLKWGMVTGAKGQPLETAFRRLRECGFEGVEPSLSHVTDEAAWIAASRASGPAAPAAQRASGSPEPQLSGCRCCQGKHWAEWN